MKSCIWNGTDKLEIIYQPVPEPLNDECLIKTLSSGVYGTDLHIINGDFDLCKPPMVPGHETCGEISKVGSDVKGFT